MAAILVTGATGFVGRTLCPVLRSAGHRVVAAVRDTSAAKGLSGVELRPVADIGADTDWEAALAGIEAVVHLAARVHVMAERAAHPLAEHRRVNAEGTRRLAEAAGAGGVRRFVFLSTVKVNGEETGSEPFSESDPPAPDDAYAVSKWEGERALFEVAARTGMEAVVLRPPLVYGEGVQGNFLSLLALCQRAPPLPLGAVANRRSLIYVGNLADAIVRCLSAPEAAGGTYLIRDGEDVSTAELIRRVAAALGRPARLLPVPVPLLRLAGRLTGRSLSVARLVYSLCVDDRKLRRELGWTPPFTMAAGLERTAAWFLFRDRYQRSVR